MQKIDFRILKWLTVFSIAMGYLEGAVVIYLRKLYYPEGFSFPLKVMDASTGCVEFLREAATLFMLLSVAVLCGKSLKERFAWFCFSFGVWDLVYYAVLKLALDWPLSWLEWDILFLIPVPWVGPVLAPCVVSVTMIVSAVVLLSKDFKLNKTSKTLMIAGAAVVFFSFIQDYILYIKEGHNAWIPGSSTALFEELQAYVPTHFNWWIFCVGELMILTALYFVYRRRNQNFSVS